jgi:hypothetical protein
MSFLDTFKLGDKPEKTLVYLLLPLFFLLIIFPAAFQSNEVFISEYHDTLSLMIPELYLMDNPLSLWNNYWNTGYSEIASFNSDRFYPFSFPLSYLTHDIFIINIIILINLYIAYLAFFKLGTLVVKNTDLLMLFSLGYMLSGVLISRVFIGHILFVYSLAWIPLVYYFFLKIVWKSETTAVNIIGLALCETILVFANLGYFNFFVNAILVVFFLYYLLAHKINKQKFVALSASAILFGLLSSVKLIPGLSLMPYIQRIDMINPLGDGGLLENNFASFIFGTPIDTVFGSYETMALIGIIPVFFAILALVWGDRDITIPSFFAILFSLIWADGGRTVLSFIHLLPLLDSFRNAGRIFGGILPVIVLLSLYGIYLIHQKWKNNDTFEVSDEEKKKILYGAGILTIVKLLELPWTTIPSVESALAVILIAGLLLLLYLNKTTFLSLSAYFSIALVVDAIIIQKNFNVLTESVIIKSLLMTVILLGVLLRFNRPALNNLWFRNHVFEGLLIIGILVSITGNISVLKVYDPALDQSPAIAIIEKIKENPSTTPQLWVYTAGWQFQHMDFTYWLIKNQIHPMQGYYTYSPKNMPPLALNIGDKDYYTADYIIDTAYLENGNENIPNPTFKVDNISVLKPANVLSNAFVIRDNNLVPVTIEKFSPDEVIISGSFRKGDIAVLKTAFYPGWKINNADAKSSGNMVGGVLQKDTGTIAFRFDPPDVKVGTLLTIIGIVALAVLIVKRKEFEKLLKGLDVIVPVKKSQKGRKSSR